MRNPATGAGVHEEIRQAAEAALRQLVREATELLESALRPAPEKLTSMMTGWGREMPTAVPDSAFSTAAAQSAVARALALGAPLTIAAAALAARRESERAGSGAAVNLLHGPTGRAATAAPADFAENVRRALVCSEIVCWAEICAMARRENDDLPRLLAAWQEDPVLGSEVLERVRAAFSRQPDWPGLLPGLLPKLLTDSFLAATLSEYQASWRKAIVKAVALGVPVPALSAALAAYDSQRRPARL